MKKTILYIFECLAVARIENAILQMPVGEERAGELVDIIMDMPPESILNENFSPRALYQFWTNKSINAFVASRLYAKALGLSPEKEPECIKDLVRSLAAHYQAQYELLFECWDYLKPIAVKDGLLNNDSQPKDALKIILNDGFTKAFTSISRDNRSLDKQARSIHDRAKGDIRDNRKVLEKVKLSNREVSRISLDWDIEAETSHPLLQLLLNLSDRHGKKSRVIATAFNHYGQTLVDFQREQITYHRRLF